jgi:hypothetical protein
MGESQVRVKSESLLECTVGGGESVGPVDTIFRQEAEDSH